MLSSDTPALSPGQRPFDALDAQAEDVMWPGRVIDDPPLRWNRRPRGPSRNSVPLVPGVALSDPGSTKCRLSEPSWIQSPIAGGSLTRRQGEREQRTLKRPHHFAERRAIARCWTRPVLQHFLWDPQRAMSAPDSTWSAQDTHTQR
jgi:hypothetical protein